MTYTLAGRSLIDAVRGAVEVRDGAPGIEPGATPHRLPGWTTARQADEGIEHMAAMAAGVRIPLLTAAGELVVEVTAARPAPHLRGDPVGHVALEVDGAVLERLPLATGRQSVRAALGRASAPRLVTAWLPHTAAVTVHAITADAPLERAPTAGPLWVHYGSSISHATDVVDPVGGWPVQAARALGLELTSLAFAGNAMLDPFVARVIAEQPADLITLKVGINPVNGDVFRRRTFIPALHGFLDTVRDGHPSTPIVVITALACPIHEDATGPTREVSPGRAGATPREIPPGDGSLTLRRTREYIEHVVAVRQAEDARLTALDGLELFGLDDEACLPDALHPDQEGHDRIARRFVGRLRELVPCVLAP